MSNTVLMQGNEACVEGAIAAGMRFFAGYPITPSTEIAECSALRLPQVKGHFVQMEDELSSMAAVIGASVAGVKSMTATSGPGFSLKQENIGYAALAEIPCVIVDVQRSGPSTGMPTSPAQGDVMQARWGTHGDHPVIALSPSTVNETFHLTIRAFNLAEKYRTPVILLMDEIIGHLREGFVFPDPDMLVIENRKVPENSKIFPKPYHVENGELVPAMAAFGEGARYNITGLIHDDDGFPTNSSKVAEALCTRLMEKISQNLPDIISYEEIKTEDADIVIVCYGGTMRSAMTAMEMAREVGIKVGIFRPVSIWPFPEEPLLTLSKRVKHLLVAEHNYGQILLEVQRITKNNCTVSFIGKINGTVITPDEIVMQLRGGEI